MSLLSPGNFAAALLASLTIVACGPPDEADRAKAGPIKGPFVVSNFFTPSGFMGDGAIPDRMTIGINQNCKTPRPPGAQGDCYHFLYDQSRGDRRIAPVKWTGAYWVYPSNSWGSVPGRTMIGPVDLGPKPGGGEMYGYRYVRFYAAMDVLTNPTTLQFWAGRLDGRKATVPQPYYDVGCSVFPGMDPICQDLSDPTLPHAFAPVEESAKLTSDWVQYKIDLTKFSVEQLIGAFGWSLNDSENPPVAPSPYAPVHSIYLDDIVWE